jgi:type I restriction enzyme S subunit
VTWPTALLGEVASFLNGGTPSRTRPEFFEGNIPWITGADISGADKFVNTSRSCISDDGIKHSATNLVTAGTVLLVTRTGVGKAAIAGMELAFSQDITAVLHDPQRVDRDFLLHALRHESPRYKSLAQGATIKGITREVVESTVLPLPPIEEQQRIASILDGADALRTKRRQALEKLDSLIQSVFIDMFGCVDKKVALSQLLADADLFTDGDWVESKDQDPEGGVRLTQLADIGIGRWVNKSRRYMTAERAEALKCTFLVPGDVLVARMPDPIGRACLFPGDPMPAVTAVDVCIIRPDERALDARWLVEALNLPFVHRQVESLAVGATRQRVSRTNLGRVVLPQVEVAQQKMFAGRAEAVDRLRSKAVAALAEAERLFASLQHRAFRGEL